MSPTRSTLTPSQRQRAFGAVIGAAVGDALGAPFEFRPGGTYRRAFPRRVLGGHGEMTGGGSFRWGIGEFTDDTQMGMCLTEAMLEAGGYDADVVWRWFRAWAPTASDVGVTTRASLAHADWRNVSHIGRSAGNGALMRAFPLAVAFIDVSADQRRAVVLHQSALTHGDPAAGWGAWVAVEMMRSAILGDDPVATVPALLDQMPPEVRLQFAPILSVDWQPDTDHHANGAVWGCLAQAVWALRTTDSFEDAVVAAVDLGDDADTVACVAGALAGARYGVQAIPSRWCTYVNGSITSPTGTRTYRLDDLQRLTGRLLGLAEPPEQPDEPAAGPTEVAPGVFAASLLGATAAPGEWGVVSLCRTGSRFTAHRARRQVFLIDRDDHNPDLGAAVTDAVDAIDAFLAEGRTVVVHCHGGHSRTGLVLKAWRMRHVGCTEREAHAWLAERWPELRDWSAEFREYLRTVE